MAEKVRSGQGAESDRQSRYDHEAVREHGRVSRQVCASVQKDATASEFRRNQLDSRGDGADMKPRHAAALALVAWLGFPCETALSQPSGQPTPTPSVRLIPPGGAFARGGIDLNCAVVTCWSDSDCPTFCRCAPKTKPEDWANGACKNIETGDYVSCCGFRAKDRPPK